MANIIGTNLNDTITPGFISFGVNGFPSSAGDTINGGLGADTMNGGDGNDTYFVDNVGDIVTESFDDALGGTADIVFSSVSYSLLPGTFGNKGFGIENLTLTGTGNISATGNAKNNLLTGNSGNNTLDGGLGADTMKGGKGNDFINGGSGIDTADYTGIGGAITLLAQGVVNKGTAGTDTLFLVETIIAAAGFSNTIDASSLSSSPVSISVNLALNSLLVNNIPGLGFQSFNTINFVNVIGTSQADSISGNSLSNRLDGGLGNDTLNGGLGADTMDGGDGNDTYFVDNVGDSVKEIFDDALGGTADIVFSSVSYSLLPGTSSNKGFGIENLTLTGTGNISATGNAKNNLLNGNSGNNTLDGGLGADTLVGGFGTDILLGGDGNDNLNGYGTSVNNDSQFDRLVGGAGSDIFVLGGFWGVSYVEPGDGYAIIEGWQQGQDKIQLKGANQYTLEFKSVAGIGSTAQDTEIYAIINGAKERIGIARDAINVNLNLDFTFV